MAKMLKFMQIERSPAEAPVESGAEEDGSGKKYKKCHGA